MLSKCSQKLLNSCDHNSNVFEGFKKHFVIPGIIILLKLGQFKKQKWGSLIYKANIKPEWIVIKCLKINVMRKWQNHDHMWADGIMDYQS